MTLIFIIIVVTLIFGIFIGIVTHVDGSSRVPPRPRRQAPPMPKNVKSPKKAKKYI